jgi:hypothetical protein
MDKLKNKRIYRGMGNPVAVGTNLDWMTKEPSGQFCFLISLAQILDAPLALCV